MPRLGPYGQDRYPEISFYLRLGQTVFSNFHELTLNSKQKCYKDVDVFGLYHFGKLNFGTSEMT